MIERIPKDAAERNVLGHIRDTGWSVMQVFDPDKKLPNFSYTIGLHATFQSPEIIIFGLGNDAAKQVINDIATRIKAGYRLPLHQPTNEFFQDPCVCEFIAVDQSNYNEYLGFDIWYYAGTNFPAYQCVWSDEQGKLPWEHGFNASLNSHQPLLGRHA